MFVKETLEPLVTFKTFNSSWHDYDPDITVAGLRRFYLLNLMILEEFWILPLFGSRRVRSLSACLRFVMDATTITIVAF